MNEGEMEGDGIQIGRPIEEILNVAEIQQLQEMVQRFRQKFEAALEEFRQLILQAINDASVLPKVLQFHAKNKNFLAAKEISGGEIMSWEVAMEMAKKLVPQREIVTKLSYLDNVVSIVTQLTKGDEKFTLQDALHTVEAAQRLLKERGDDIFSIRLLTDPTNVYGYRELFSNCYPINWR